MVPSGRCTESLNGPEKEEDRVPVEQVVMIPASNNMQNSCTCHLEYDSNRRIGCIFLGLYRS